MADIIEIDFNASKPRGTTAPPETIASVAFQLATILIGMHIEHIDIDAAKYWADSYKKILIQHGHQEHGVDIILDGFKLLLDQAMANFEERKKMSESNKPGNER